MGLALRRWSFESHWSLVLQKDLVRAISNSAKDGNTKRLIIFLDSCLMQLEIQYCHKSRFKPSSDTRKTIFQKCALFTRPQKNSYLFLNYPTESFIFQQILFIMQFYSYPNHQQQKLFLHHFSCALFEGLWLKAMDITVHNKRQKLIIIDDKYS